MSFLSTYTISYRKGKRNPIIEWICEPLSYADGLVAACGLSSLFRLVDSLYCKFIIRWELEQVMLHDRKGIELD
jgi:hypothetical protein